MSLSGPFPCKAPGSSHYIPLDLGSDLCGSDKLGSNETLISQRTLAQVKRCFEVGWQSPSLSAFLESVLEAGQDDSLESSITSSQHNPVLKDKLRHTAT